MPTMYMARRNCLALKLSDPGPPPYGVSPSGDDMK